MAVANTTSPEAVRSWLERMRIIHPSRAMTESACAKMLGLSHNALSEMKTRGCDKRTALAMRALIHCMRPWGSE